MEKDFKHHQANHTGKSVFSTEPFVSIRKAHNLRSHAVRSKLYPFQRATGSYKCNTPR